MVNNYLPLLYLALGIAGVLTVAIGGIVLILVLVGVI
ncbi:hypothetical protein J2T58_001791 [Methanocalculus alkaliphilus]|nr:hypothetical protein [Methanocalculus alkaliphilus]